MFEPNNPKIFQATLDPDMSYRIDQPGVVDSGANISVTNLAVAKKFNLPILIWSQPFHIMFANKSRFLCTQYADFGPVLGKVAIVDSAPDTLISVAVLTKRGFDVHFGANGKGVGIYYNQQKKFKGARIPTHICFTLISNPLLLPTGRSSMYYPRTPTVPTTNTRPLVLKRDHSIPRPSKKSYGYTSAWGTLHGQE